MSIRGIYTGVITKGEDARGADFNKTAVSGGGSIRGEGVVASLGSGRLVNRGDDCSGRAESAASELGEMASGERTVFGWPNSGKRALGGSRFGERRSLPSIPGGDASSVACGSRSVMRAGLGREKTEKWAGCVN